MKKLALILTVAAFIFCLGQQAQAAVIFSDDFNLENGGSGVTNYTGFANWSVTNGSVDLIGNGYFDFYPGNGLYVDLDGSTHSGGTLDSGSVNLSPGDYVLEFVLGGSARSGSPSDTVRVTFGSLYTEDFTYAYNSGLHSISRNFSLASATSGSLSFQQFGTDNMGLILDNVKLSKVDKVIPEPSSLFFLGTGLLGLAGLKRKK
ncbi:MAG: PEP-CTERM sorting domain-containing protein [Candidatus Omnitrophica bacterium]|nr:PEP-CTERM sorting domain-containing protein [Candidatus Omnitrophota bacterium]